MQTCPTCGQAVGKATVPQHNIMKRYINSVTGREVTMNSGDAELVVKGTKYIRKDLYVAQVTAGQQPPSAPEPITPIIIKSAQP